jgi:hypothetical protein
MVAVDGLPNEASLEASIAVEGVAYIQKRCYGDLSPDNLPPENLLFY